MNECHKHGFKHGLFSDEAVWVGPPDSDGRRGVKLDGFEWYSLPDPIFRNAVAAAREADLAPEVFEAMGEESQSTSLYDGRLPESVDIPGLAQFVEICLDKADREKTTGGRSTQTRIWRTGHLRSRTDGILPIP